MNRLRIAHCSDIHLDSDSYRLGGHAGAREFYRAAFRVALDEMLSHAPDLMLIAGDLFDSNDATDDTIQWAMRTLAALPCPVGMIPGNHDCLEQNAIFHRYDFGGLGNVKMLLAEDGELARFPELGVAIWGKGMVDHHPGYHPLGGCPERPGDCQWYLGMGHGIFVPRGESTDRSSPIRMEEIESSPCDYLALGHHHAAMELVTDETAAAYCGPPTDSVGHGATYAVVELEVERGGSLSVHAIEDFAD